MPWSADEIWLRTKAAIVRTPLEPTAEKLRRLATAWHRFRVPELREVHNENEYMRAALAEILDERSCCVDVGCHIGSFLSLLTRLAPHGQHIAIEPTPQKCRWLQSKFPEVEVIQAAASDSAGVAKFCEDRANPGYSHLTTDGVGYSVKKVRLDDILQLRSRIDFIKIDTEGHELEVLNGAVDAIDRLKPVLAFECGTEYQPASSGPRRRALFNLVTARLGCDMFTFSGYLKRNPPLSFDEFRMCGIYPFRAFNFLAVPRVRFGNVERTAK